MTGLQITYGSDAKAQEEKASAFIEMKIYSIYRNYRIVYAVK